MLPVDLPPHALHALHALSSGAPQAWHAVSAGARHALPPPAGHAAAGHAAARYAAARYAGPLSPRVRAVGSLPRGVLSQAREHLHVGRALWVRGGGPDPASHASARRGAEALRSLRSRLGRLRGQLAVAGPGPLRTRVEAGAVVTGLFVGVLGREPEPDALLRFGGRLASGAAPRELAEELAGTEEVAQARRAAAEETFRNRLRAAWSAGRSAQPPLVFLHTMKTAGTSVKAAISSWYDPQACLVDTFLDELVLVPPPVLAVSAFVTGHLPYEALALFPRRPRTLTVLRDPVDRTVSHYLHVRRSPEVAGDPDFTLERFLDSPGFAAVTGNYQARYLAHEIGLAQAWVGFSPEQRFAALGEPFPPSHPLPLQSLFDATPLALDEEALAARAGEHLAAVEHVGVVEQVGRLVAEVAAALGRPAPAIGWANARTRADLGVELPGRLLRRIDAATQVDRVLYEQARRRAGL